MILLSAFFISSTVCAHNQNVDKAGTALNEYQGEISAKSTGTLISPSNISFKILLEDANFSNTPIEMVEVVMQ